MSDEYTPTINDEQVEAKARAIFAEEQCDRRQKATPESLEENWLTRLDDRDREEYRAMARAFLGLFRSGASTDDAVIDQQQQEVIATDPLSFWPTGPQPEGVA